MNFYIHQLQWSFLGFGPFMLSLGWSIQASTLPPPFGVGGRFIQTTCGRKRLFFLSILASITVLSLFFEFSQCRLLVLLVALSSHIDFNYHSYILVNLLYALTWFLAYKCSVARQAFNRVIRCPSMSHHLSLSLHKSAIDH